MNEVKKNIAKLDDVRQEVWNGFTIRFFVEGTVYWTVAMDVAEALGYERFDTHLLDKVPVEWCGTKRIRVSSEILRGKRKTQDVLCLSDQGLYFFVFRSDKEAALPFQRWLASEVLPAIQKECSATALQMLYKEKQKEAMEKLHIGLADADKVDYIIANRAANRITTAMFGLSGEINKGTMNDGMLAARQPILDEVTNLMILKEKYDLPISVEQSVKAKWVK